MTRPEHLLQRLEAHIGQAVEQPRAGEQAVGDQSMEVGMEVQILAEGVDRHDDAGQALMGLPVDALLTSWSAT